MAHFKSMLLVDARLEQALGDAPEVRDVDRAEYFDL